MTMSELFDVSINEILSGKRLSKEEYKEAAEENIKQPLKASSFSLEEKIDYFKKKVAERTYCNDGTLGNMHYGVTYSRCRPK